MKNFNFYSPTEVIFGKDTQNKVGGAVKKYGGSKVLLVYGGGSVIKSGLLDQVKKSLDSENIAYTEIGGVKPNPRLSLANEGVKIAADFSADFILAVGGGSAIDTAKAIAICAPTPNKDIWDYWSGKTPITEALPVATVLTISAAGSETSSSAVLTNEDNGIKTGCGSELMRPKFSILNPELTFTLPKYQIACGVVDIIMHTLERYFTKTEGNQLTDRIGEAVLKTTIENGTIAMNNPNDYDAMSEIMWCGSLSHNDLTGLGVVSDWATHDLGHALSSKFDVAHGASLATMWPSWAEYVYNEKPERFVQYGKNVWNITEGSDEEIIKKSIKATAEYFKSIGMPTNFTELGVGIQDEDVLNYLTQKSTIDYSTTLGAFKVLNKEDVYNIYKLANK